MSWLKDSRASNIIYAVIFVVLVSGFAVAGYMACGWSFGDSLYMTVLTIFTVGFEEVHPVDTVTLRTITILLIVLGCTGMIYFTGALIQFITFGQLQELVGASRMKKQIEMLENHVIICGYGRLGAMLAKQLSDGKAGLVIIELDETRCDLARSLGHLCLHADGAEESVLQQAGVARARTLASVVSSDPVNVFITLSARSLNPSLQIIARGEEVSTEKKLLQAGANLVVLPTHICAEQIASLILFPSVAGVSEFSRLRSQIELDLSALGLEVEVVITAEGSPFAGRTVDEIEARSEHSFFIVGTQKAGSGVIERPQPTTRIEPGDAVTVIGRSGRASVLRNLSEPMAVVED